MNTDNDYDNDGNNIVPCPICLSVYCPSKEGGECPEEDEYIKSMQAPHTEQKGWRTELLEQTKKSWGFIATPEKRASMMRDYENRKAFIERTLQEEREGLVKRIMDGRIAIANIGTVKEPEYIYHIPGDVFDRLIKDTPPLKAKE